MDNFFSSALDYNAFKKALKATKGETVVINILSSDDSLKTPVKDKGNKQRKSMSSKYDPSPFGKFFGSKNSDPVDMNDFSGWRNKNYRKTEQSFDTSSYEDDDDSLFSLSNFMKDKSPNTYNELDQAKSELQKPITQLPNDDPTLKKFSLDGYMHKLEESILAKDKFSENDDLLEPIVSDDDFVNQNTRNQINKHQDENFFGVNDSIERFAFDEAGSGSNFSLNSDELDRVKDRLSKLEKEAKDLTDKAADKSADSDDTSESSNDESKDAFDDITLPVDKLTETKSETRGKKLNEVVMHTETAKTTSSSITKPVLINTDEINVDELEQKTETKKEVLTKDDFRDMTNEFMTKLSETLGKSVDTQNDDENGDVSEYMANQDEMQMKINELLKSREKAEKETEERFRKIEEERQKIDDEYKSKIKEMEESYSKKYEEFKQKMYIEKLDAERKIKESESKIKIKKEEIENKLNSKQVGAILRKELKSNFNISNLEMEKKLLEYEKIEGLKQKEVVVEEKPKPEKKVIKKSPVVIVKETIKKETKPAPKKTTKSRKRRRRIDSDIIGGIQF